eukprot:2248848-Lingulodinium_polyedra.AAC.1
MAGGQLVEPLGRPLQLAEPAPRQPARREMRGPSCRQRGLPGRYRRQRCHELHLDFPRRGGAVGRVPRRHRVLGSRPLRPGALGN